MDRLNWLEERRRSGNLRQLFPVKRMPDGTLQVEGDGGKAVFHDFSSNDYLALSLHKDLITASRKYLELYGTGAGAARLMSGDLTLYHDLERQVAELKRQEAALLFGSGYLANCGVIPALAGRQDVIFCDRLNHASIYDGCRLSRARLVRFHHNDLNHLEDLLRSKRGQGEALIVVESIYSMDGDRCPLKDLVLLKEKYGCLLMVDEAHATGLFGAHGGGVIEEDGVSSQVDIAMGTFGKALGSYGAYVAASRSMVDFLVNRARAFIYSTALPPAVIGASAAAIRIVQEHPELRQDLFAKVALFKSILKQGGLESLGPSQIIPVLVGESVATVKLAEQLRQRNIFATAVRPPTVPEGTARLRFSVTLHQSDIVLKETATALLEILGR
ncbi:MAG: 8-amino-7-oxononanoate synthase [Desulfobulbaceae bacterium]|uniref:8-amino-7-ketopelargonate synthase n=1 Tax=Candidatus Desulfobia pelagia TaxID=2841692 RepID=A0A8J6NG37_9BACT|nr:8-amino-7-oxononanoate synthase [Candidatus Desulfobia pelagia]